MGFLVGSGLAAAAVLIYAARILRQVLDMPQGTRSTARLAGRVETGALMFLEQGFTRVMGIAVLLLAAFVAAEMLLPELQLRMQTGLAILVGALAGMLSCLTALLVAARLDARAGYFLQNRGRATAFQIMTGGSLATGLVMVGIAVIGLVLTAKLVSGAPLSIVGYALGVSATAVLARTGGEVFAHAMRSADGFALGGSAEAPKGFLPIAGRLGNVLAGVGGLGLDLVESQIAALVASALIGLLILRQAGPNASEYVRGLPFWMLALGLVSTVVGVFCARSGRRAFSGGFFWFGHFSALVVFVAGLCVYGRFQGSSFFLRGVAYDAMGPVWAGITGLLMVFAVRMVSGIAAHFGSRRNRRRKPLPAEAIASGAVTMILCVLMLALALFLSNRFAGLYGVCVAALGMLIAAGMTIAEGVRGPIAANTWTVYRVVCPDSETDDESAELEREFRRRAGRDSSITSVCATFSTVALMVCFMVSVNSLAFKLTDSLVLAGMVVGAGLPSFFRMFLLKASGRCVLAASREACRQLEAEADSKEDKKKRAVDPMACLDIAVCSAVNSALVVGVLAVVLPVAVGAVMGVQGLAGMLAGTVAASLAMGFRSADIFDVVRFNGDNHPVGGESPADTDALDQPIKSLVKLMCITALVFTPLFVWIGR